MEAERTAGQLQSSIPRNYHYGEVRVTEAKYLPLAFSDHFGHVVRISLPDQMTRVISPKSRSSFKLRPEVIKDILFKQRLEEAMQSWERVRNFQGMNTDTLLWWEVLVKQGIKKIGIQRSKEMNKEKREQLNLLLLRQVYLIKKIQQGQMERMGELKTVNLFIDKWYIKESEKIQHQSRITEFQENEKINHLSS